VEINWSYATFGCVLRLTMDMLLRAGKPVRPLGPSLDQQSGACELFQEREMIVPRDRREAGVKC
jgi:hypothetical protein